MKESEITADMPTVSPSEARPADVEAPIQMVALLERTQRTEDLGGFLALFDPEAVWVTGGGRRLIGLDIIGAFTRQFFLGGPLTVAQVAIGLNTSCS